MAAMACPTHPTAKTRLSERGGLRRHELPRGTSGMRATRSHRSRSAQWHPSDTYRYDPELLRIPQR